VSLFNKAIGLNPHSERTLIKKAVACTNLNQFEEALGILLENM
jgi:Flp pilus assembly protein TadD